MEKDYQSQILENRQTINPNFIDVYCRLHNGNGCCFRISLMAKIGSLIDLLKQSQLNLPKEFCLSHSGQLLQNVGMTLKELGMKGKVMIHIVNKAQQSLKQIKIDVIVYWKGQNLVMRAKRGQNILKLKQKLYRLLGLQTKNQLLIFRGVVLDNSKTLNELKIEPYSLFCLHYQQHLCHDLCNQEETIRLSKSNEQQTLALSKHKQVEESPQALQIIQNPQNELKLIRSAEGVRWQLLQNFPIYQVQIHEAETDKQFNLRNFNFNLFSPIKQSQIQKQSDSSFIQRQLNKDKNDKVLTFPNNHLIIHR